MRLCGNIFGADVMDEMSRELLSALERENVTAEEVRTYIDAGADVNYADMFGKTVLMRAVRCQSPEVIRVLIEAGVDVNAKDKYDIDALEAEYPFGYPRYLRVHEGWTALMSAVIWSDDSEVIKILLDAGADVNTYYESSTDNFMDYTETVLSLAVREGCSSEKIKLLINAGANIKEKCFYEYNYGEYWTYDATLLMLATRHCDSEVVKLLVNAGIDIEAEDDFGETALIWAVRHETDEQTYPDAENVKALIDLGADIEATNAYGETPLMIVAQEDGSADDIEILELLLYTGADVNAKDRFGNTALMYAAGNNSNPEVIKALIEAGADIFAKDNYGKTVLDYAQSDEVKKLIRKYAK